MRKNELVILREEFKRMIENSLEVRKGYENGERSETDKVMSVYEDGMIRGLERGLGLIEMLEEIKEDRKMRK